MICCDEASALCRRRPVQNCAADAGVTGTAPDTPLHAVLRRSSPRRRHIPARAAGGGAAAVAVRPEPAVTLSTAALRLWLRDELPDCRDPASPDVTREQKRDLSCLVTEGRQAGWSADKDFLLAGYSRSVRSVSAVFSWRNVIQSSMEGAPSLCEGGKTGGGGSLRWRRLHGVATGALNGI